MVKSWEESFVATVISERRLVWIEWLGTGTELVMQAERARRLVIVEGAPAIGARIGAPIPIYGTSV